MRFWDASAVVPLLLTEPSTVAFRTLLAGRPEGLTVWWATRVECLSALQRAWRLGRIESSTLEAAARELQAYAERWSEVPPSDEVRDLASRLVRVHDGLRASDAFQLAAALVLTERSPAEFDLVSADRRLGDAAAREGFRVLDGTVSG